MCLKRFLHHILYLLHIRGNRDFVFIIIIVQFMMSGVCRIHFGLQNVFVCLYITPISLSSLCKLVWRHKTSKMYVKYILSSVYELASFPQLSVIKYVGLCVFKLPISRVMTERMFMLSLSYNHHQTESMNHYPLFRVRSWSNGMRCMSIFLCEKPVYDNRVMR